MLTAKFADVAPQPRRHHFFSVLEHRNVEFAASGIVYDQPLSSLRSDGLVRRHRTYGFAQCESHSLNRGQSDANAGERAGTARHRKQLDMMTTESALAQKPVDRREEFLVARASSFHRCSA